MSDLRQTPTSSGGGLLQRTLGGFAWLAMSSAVQGLLRIVVVAILARLLTPADFGVVGAALIVVGFADLFSRLGVGPSLVQFPELREAHVQTGFTVAVLLGFVMTGATLGTAPLAARFLDLPNLVPVLGVMAWIFPIKALSTVSDSLIQRELSFKRLAGVDVVTYSLGYGGVGIAMALLGFGVWSLAWALLAQAALQAAILLRLQPHTVRPGIEGVALRELMRSGSGFTTATVFNYIATRGDNIVVGRWLGAGALGLYDRAYALMNSSNGVLGTVLNRVLFPSFARVQHDPQQLADAYLRCSSLLALVALPTTLYCVALAPEIVGVALGDQWDAAVPAFQLLSAGVFFRLAYKMCTTVAKGCGELYHNAVIQLVYASIIVGGAVLTVRFGVAGVAASTLLGLFVNYVLLSRLCNRLTGVPWRAVLRGYAPAAVLSAVVGGVCGLGAQIGRADGLGPGVTLGAATGMMLLCVGGLVFRLPHRMLGRDAYWLLRKVAQRKGAASVRLGLWLDRRSHLFDQLV